jgi:hypothetical protein
MELDALYKRLRDDAQKLREERATLEGMMKSHDELLREMAEEYGLNRMGENDDKYLLLLSKLSMTLHFPREGQRVTPA